MVKKRREDGASPSLQMRHFTDRVDQTQAFERCLNLAAGKKLPVLMSYGVDGAGKSWLLKHLRERLGQTAAGSIPGGNVAAWLAKKIGGVAWKHFQDTTLVRWL